MPSDRVCCLEAKHPFSAWVPGSDYPVQSLANDRVIRTRDNPGEQRILRLRLRIHRGNLAAQLPVDVGVAGAGEETHE